MGIIILIVIGVIIIIGVSSSDSKAKEIAKLKKNYEELLKGTNKRAALAAGRAYHSALRKNQALTIYDEQAITNDLSTMKETPAN